MEWRKLGDILVSWGKVTEPQLQAGLQQQREQAIGRRIGEILAARGWITEREIALAVSEQIKLPVHDLSQAGSIDAGVLSLVPLEYAQSRLLLPVARHDEVLTVAMADPFDRRAVHDLSSLTGMQIGVVIGLESEIRAVLRARWRALDTDPSAAGAFSPVHREKVSSSASGAISADGHESWSEQNVGPGSAGPVPALARMCVLVVDDSPTILRVLQAVLVAQNCEVITAKDGLDGFETAHQRTPDLIVTDTMMPRMDGFALVRNLKENAGTRGIPVIMLTSSDEAASEERALRLGAEDYIAKTLEPEQLLARVIGAVNRLRRIGERP
ncbi:MAG: hypothetical protein A3H96_13445 [Acidobacteria bacterium RIFCSPLOWO2_02_FULL_67_36]|nr:MAG: hypothetical protein A3H96_13445 [Acidobacteria bacterium RIFCSPLOWO2_02_FULL_67_36]OFW18550.1 MAG: hypothetical protein A3G21_20990 [Acidobacteria bacterium RIFCSPLOWO2_12_FULL_66_21]